ncbi:MAG: hypothetical protein ACRC26_05030 [Bacteroidales bacterium]
METVVVNDTNIFIDLLSINLLDEFFRLPIVIHTNDFIINELTEPEQKQKVLSYSPARLYIKRYSAPEVAEIGAFHATCENNVSFVDCSVWLYAQQNSYRLLTGDGKLRKSASASGTTVSGILFIFDLMVDSSIISPEMGYQKLEELSVVNKRLPSEEIKKRLLRWRRD